MNFRVLSLAILFSSTTFSGAIGQDDAVAQCMAQAPDASEAYCSCMATAFSENPDIFEEIRSNGGMPSPGDISEELEDAEATCRSEAG